MQRLNLPEGPRVITLGVLVIAWVMPWFSIPPEGLSNAELALVSVGCAYAGGAAWVLAPHHRQARYGALAGVLMFASWIIVLLVGQALTGTLDLTAGGAETPFSLLIELPFWLGVPLIVAALLGAAAWLIVRAIVMARSAGHAA